MTQNGSKLLRLAWNGYLLGIQKNGSNSDTKSKVKLKDVCTRIHDFH